VNFTIGQLLLLLAARLLYHMELFPGTPAGVFLELK